MPAALERPSRRAVRRRKRRVDDEAELRLVASDDAMDGESDGDGDGGRDERAPNAGALSFDPGTAIG